MQKRDVHGVFSYIVTWISGWASDGLGIRNSDVVFQLVFFLALSGQVISWTQEADL